MGHRLQRYLSYCSSWTGNWILVVELDFPTTGCFVTQKLCPQNTLVCLSSCSHCLLPGHRHYLFLDHSHFSQQPCPRWTSALAHPADRKSPSSRAFVAAAAVPAGLTYCFSVAVALEWLSRAHGWDYASNQMPYIWVNLEKKRIVITKDIMIMSSKGIYTHKHLYIK